MSKNNKPNKNTHKSKSVRHSSKQLDKHKTKPKPNIKSALFNIVGELQMTKGNFGFVLNPNSNNQDVFISQRHLNTANHGDIVEVSIFDGPKGLEGQVVRIVDKSDRNIVGTLRVLSGNLAVVVPDNVLYGREYMIHLHNRKGAIDNDKVLIQPIDSTSAHKIAKVIEVLGQSTDIGIDVLSIVREYGLQIDFDSEVINQAKSISQTITEQDTIGRIDYRDLLVVTIDGDDTKDIDDAISISNTSTGWILGVHIADVSHYVRSNSLIDREALRRGTSTYFANSVIPMLPPQLSNGICSLNPGVDRLTLSIIMDIDTHGNVKSSTVTKGIVNTTQLTYSLASSILNNSCEEQYVYLRPMLQECIKLSTQLTIRRKSRGSIDFDLPESKLTLDNNGIPIDITRKSREKSHILIEEFMLIANETIAHKYSQLKIPFVYRVHARPDPAKMKMLLDFVNVFGIQLQGNIDDIQPRNIADMLDSIDPKLSKIVSTITLRSQMKATYEASNLGHFGLAAKYYCHFTSPIRRYPDLMIHRIISTYMTSPKTINDYDSIVQTVAKQSSIRERVSIEVERKILDLKKSQYMLDKIGCIYSGTISGVISTGLFVELDNTIEGKIHIDDLPQDNYILDSTLLTLRGTKHTYMICDVLQVMVHSVDQGRTRFVLAPN